MPKVMKTRDLARLLESHGFAEMRAGKGVHRIFKHNTTGLTLTIPENNSEIRPVHLAAIKKQIRNFSIVSESEFEQMFEN